MLEPISTRQWNEPCAAHLMNRAGFGVTPAEITALARRKPVDVVTELVDYEKTYESDSSPTWVNADSDKRPDRRAVREMSDEDREAFLRERRQREMSDLLELRAWWLYRMRFSKRPLQEKLTLFWHGHFATSIEKVREAYVLYAQNETFRRLANGNWRELVLAVAKDPAMLIYLDNAQSRAEAPNENFARELMELFTLGEGNYTERDIKEAARAFTGWSIEDDRFVYKLRLRAHDNGPKSFMKKRGPLYGEDIIDAILDHKEAAPFICRKLWRFFAYDEPEPEIVNGLADVLRKNKFEFKPVLQTMFLSRAFYSTKAARTQIKSPVQWLVGLCRSLDAPLPGPDVSSLILRALGQELFAPPNVKGWDGGYTWITTATLMQRYNFAGVLVKGGEAFQEVDQSGRRFGGPGGMLMRRGLDKLARLPSLVDPAKILPESARESTATAKAHLQMLLYQVRLPPEQSAALDEALAKMPEPKAWSDNEVRDVIHVMMSTPYFQLT